MNITKPFWEKRHATTEETAVARGWVVAVRIGPKEGFTRSAVLCSHGLAETVCSAYTTGGVEAVIVKPTDEAFAKETGAEW